MSTKTCVTSNYFILYKALRYGHPSFRQAKFVLGWTNLNGRMDILWVKKFCCSDWNVVCITCTKHTCLAHRVVTVYECHGRIQPFPSTDRDEDTHVLRLSTRHQCPLVCNSCSTRNSIKGQGQVLYSVISRPLHTSIVRNPVQLNTILLYLLLYAWIVAILIIILIKTGAIIEWKFI